MDGIWKDLKTTIVGALIIIGVTIAMFKGLCSFDQWWQIILVVIALVGAGGAIVANRNTKEKGK